MSNPLVKFLTKTATSVAGSVISGELKKHAKGFIDKHTAKSAEAARRETAGRIGYETDHYTITPKQEVKFKSSALFLHEWLSKAPGVTGKVVKDEENGQIYFDGSLMSPDMEVELMAKFAKATELNSPALPGHFAKALDLMNVTDLTAIRFKQEFGGWDPKRKSVIDTFLLNCFGSALESNPDYARMLFRMWIIGTARRAMSPGASLDGCLVLQGPAGAGKTRFFRGLLPEPFEKRTGEIICDVKNPRKFVEAIVGKTVACFDELSVLDNPKSDETFKQLLSAEFVDVRMAWARKERRYLIRQGFAGTKNDPKIITDQGMSRRMWIIRLNDSKRIDYNFLQENRRALWMEAVHCAQRGDSCILGYDDQKVVEENNKRYHT